MSSIEKRTYILLLLSPLLTAVMLLSAAEFTAFISAVWSPLSLSLWGVILLGIGRGDRRESYGTTHGTVIPTSGHLFRGTDRSLLAYGLVCLVAGGAWFVLMTG